MRKVVYIATVLKDNVFGQEHPTIVVIQPDNNFFFSAN